jgi:hypothetical protein
LKIELPVRSAVLKQDTGGSVVRWVTTSEYPLLYVFAGLVLIFGRGRMYSGKRRCSFLVGKMAAFTLRNQA